MSENLLIVFVKNPILGKVKTRLADHIGDEKALQVYKYCLRHIRSVSSELKDIDVEFHFAEYPNAEIWPPLKSKSQCGKDIGDRMLHAFNNGFDFYKKLVLIGSDIPTINSELIKKAFNLLDDHQVVLGPAQDGGYYLIGKTQMIPEVFEGIPWSTSQVFEKTKSKLGEYKLKELTVLRDIDTLQDLEESRILEEI